MSTPTVTPPQRDPADVAPAESYHPSDRVWVYRDGWRAGVIEAVSRRALTVTFRLGAPSDTGVDSFTAPYVSARSDDDPALDRRGHGRGAPRPPAAPYPARPASAPARGSAA